MTASRRTPYDHEPAWARIAEAGGRGWDDLPGQPSSDSYVPFEAWLGSLPHPTAGARALDLGCGGGQVTLRLHETGYRAVGVDYSPTAAGLARANAGQVGAKVEFVVGDCLDLADAGIPLSAFDIVVDNSVLHCLTRPSDRARFLAGACGAPKPDGLFFSQTMSAEGDFRAEELGVDPDRRVDSHEVRYWVLQDELVAELAAAGLHVVTQRRVADHDGEGFGDLIITVCRKS